MDRDKVPLNQIYREKRTFRDYPEIKQTYDDITQFTMDNDFCRETSDGHRYPKGRRYDDAVLFHQADFNNKLVCDLGARDGIFGAWLTKFVDKIHVSDYFEEWGKGTTYDLGQIGYWTDLWGKAAPNPERMVVETQDMTNLTYDDNMFDIVISTSVIEHIYNQKDWTGDMVAMKEMVRVCKPGGLILLSTDISKHEGKWVSGTYYYSEKDLFERLIDYSGCELIGPYDFSFNHPDNNAETTHNGFGPVSPVVFALRKPEKKIDTYS